MTVKDLKEKLLALPNDMKIYTYGEPVGAKEYLCTVEKFLLNRVKIGRIKDGKLAQRPCKETSGAERCLIIS